MSKFYTSYDFTRWLCFLYFKLSLCILNDFNPIPRVRGYTRTCLHALVCVCVDVFVPYLMLTDSRRVGSQHPKLTGVWVRLSCHPTPTVFSLITLGLPVIIFVLQVSFRPLSTRRPGLPIRRGPYNTSWPMTSNTPYIFFFWPPVNRLPLTRPFARRILRPSFGPLNRLSFLLKRPRCVSHRNVKPSGRRHIVILYVGNEYLPSRPVPLKMNL